MLNSVGEKSWLAVECAGKRLEKGQSQLPHCNKSTSKPKELIKRILQGKHEHNILSNPVAASGERKHWVRAGQGKGQG